MKRERERDFFFAMVQIFNLTLLEPLSLERNGILLRPYWKLAFYTFMGFGCFLRGLYCLFAALVSMQKVYTHILSTILYTH